MAEVADEWRIGCPIRWRIEYMMASFSLNVAEGWRKGMADKKIHVTDALHHTSMPSHGFENTYIPEPLLV
jgi:hypothetical protein